MVITTPRGTDAARAVVAELEVAVLHDQVREHVPADVAETARAVAATHRVDVLLSVGGGSATGLAKAVALTTGLPIVAVPTTYAGSEATDIWGITQGTTKVTGTDLRVVPSAVVYDASLAVGLPLGLTVASGLNASRTRSTPSGHHVLVLPAPGSRCPAPTPSAAGYVGSWTLHATSCSGDCSSRAPISPHARCRPLAPACTTRSATSSAACSTCPTPRPTRSCCREWSTSTSPTCRRSSHCSRRPSARSAVAGLDQFYDALGAPRGPGALGLRDAEVAQAVPAVLASVPPSNPAPVDAAVAERLLRG